MTGLDKFRASTSKTVLKLNGNLTSSQGYMTITKSNNILPTNNIVKKNIKKKDINNKNEMGYKKASNALQKKIQR